MPKLISVHVAKAGGSSLRRVFTEAFGDRLFVDNFDNPADPLSPRVLDPVRYGQPRPVPAGIDCVHGHFHPAKYLIPKDAILSTILRHPVDNIISIYFFWKTMPKGNDRLHDYFIDQNLTLLETARLPLLRWLLSKTYFGGFDMQRFHLIGRHDRREQALEDLGRLTGLAFKTGVHENVTPNTTERREAQDDLAIRRQLEDIVSEDVRFYERFAR